MRTAARTSRHRMTPAPARWGQGAPYLDAPLRKVQTLDGLFAPGPYDPPLDLRKHRGQKGACLSPASKVRPKSGLFATRIPNHRPAATARPAGRRALSAGCRTNPLADDPLCVDCPGACRLSTCAGARRPVATAPILPARKHALDETATFVPDSESSRGSEAAGSALAPRRFGSLIGFATWPHLPLGYKSRDFIHSPPRSTLLERPASDPMPVSRRRICNNGAHRAGGSSHG